MLSVLLLPHHPHLQIETNKLNKRAEIKENLHQ